MNNVLTFTRKPLPVAYQVGPKLQRTLEDAIFLSGVAATMIAPVVGYCTNGGPLRPVMFVGVAVLGTIVGLIKYNGFFNGELTLLSVGAGPRTDENVKVNLKKAA